MKTGTKFLSKFFIVFAGFSVLVAPFAQAFSFTDVHETDWFSPFVKTLVEKNIIDDGTEYRPGDSVNRAEMAKLVVEAFHLTLAQNPSTPTFKDVPVDAWYSTYVETAAANQVIGGYATADGPLTGYFGPEDPVTREQAAKMLNYNGTHNSIEQNFAGTEFVPDMSCDPFYKDVPETRWSYDFIQTLKVNSIIDGYDDETFRPENPINRAEIAKIMAKSLAPQYQPCSLKIDSAGAVYPTSVELCFNMEFDPTSALNIENYAIEEQLTGDPLMITSVEASSDPLCVVLTTPEQAHAIHYDLTVVNVKSSSGLDLWTDDNANTTSFDGYFAIDEPSPLHCEKGENTSPLEVQKGATNVEFLTLNCIGSSFPSVIESIIFDHIGSEKVSDISSVYMYVGDERISDGRVIDVGTKKVAFDNLNYAIDAEEEVDFRLVADIAADATVDTQHGFEIVSEESIEFNAVYFWGDFPIQGPLITIGN